MMIGTGQVGKLLRIQLFESFCVAILGAIALKLGGLPSLLATAGIVILLLTGSFLPRQVLRLLKS
jgi:predicted PurR-regulated permease PerM